MDNYAVPVSLLTGAIIIVAEFARPRKRGWLDFMTGFHLIYFLCFCLVPLFLLWGSPELDAKWNWMSQVPLDSPAYGTASWMALGGYLAVQAGYWSGLLQRREPAGGKPAKPALSERKLLAGAIGLTGIGAISILLYSYAIGGFGHLFEYAIVLRKGDEKFSSPLLFAKNLMPLVQVASYLFFGLLKGASDRRIRRIAAWLFVLAFALSLVVLFTKAGRMALFGYLILFPAVPLMARRRLNWKVVATGVVLFIFFTLFGKQMFNAFLYPEGFQQRLDTVSGSGASHAVSDVLAEFAFPYVTLANTLQQVPHAAEYRYFSDVAVGWMDLLPDRLVPVSLPPTVSQLNTQTLEAAGTIPVDLVSYGYWSFGATGVLLGCLMFGLLLAAAERWTDHGHPVMHVMRLAWLEFFAFRVMYADPQMSYNAMFALGAATLWVLASVVRSRPETSRQVTNQPEEAIAGWPRLPLRSSS